MKIKKQKKGISLIVLVITIIVMIILAAAVVITLNRSGMKNMAKDAVEKYDNKQLQELANLAWSEAYADNVGKKEEELLPILKTAVENALIDNKLNPKDYGIYVTTSGVEIAKGWLQTSAQTVVKGDTVLELGDIVNYYDTANNGSEKYTGKWGVLGAENGNLLIITDEDEAPNIDETDFDIDISTIDTLEEQLEFLSLYKSKLNEKVAIYGKGKGAVKSRLPKVEDITRLLNNNLKESSEELELDDGTKYTVKYGDEITYYWDTTEVGTVCVEFPNGKTITGGKLEQFVWYDGSEFHIEKAPTEVPIERQKICTIKNEVKYFEVIDKPNISDKAYDLIFTHVVRRCDDSCLSCTGSSCHDVKVSRELYVDNDNFYCFFIDGTYVSTSVYIENYIGKGMACTFDGISLDIYGEPTIVVELSPNIQLTGSSDTSWNIL